MPNRTNTSSIDPRLLGEALKMLLGAEGKVPNLYPDTNGNLTIGNGFLIRKEADFLALDLEITDPKSRVTRSATEAEKKADWEAMKDLQGKKQNHNPKHFEHMTQTRMSEEVMERMLPEMVETYYNELSNSIGAGAFNKLSDEQKLGLLDMYYNLGANEFGKFEKLIDAAKRGDAEEMARQSFLRSGENPDGTPQRNWNRLWENYKRLRGVDPADKSHDEELKKEFYRDFRKNVDHNGKEKFPDRYRPTPGPTSSTQGEPETREPAMRTAFVVSEASAGQAEMGGTAGRPGGQTRTMEWRAEDQLKPPQTRTMEMPNGNIPVPGASMAGGFLRQLGQAVPELARILDAPVERWNLADVRTVMLQDDYWRQGKDTELVRGKAKQWHDGVYGTDPQAMDWTGRPIEPKPKRAIDGPGYGIVTPNRRTADGYGFDLAQDRLANALGAARAQDKDGEHGAVRRLQRGLNALASDEEVQPLKLDGVLGPKTAARTDRMLRERGLNPLLTLL